MPPHLRHGWLLPGRTRARRSLRPRLLPRRGGGASRDDGPLFAGHGQGLAAPRGQPAGVRAIPAAPLPCQDLRSRDGGPLFAGHAPGYPHRASQPARGAGYSGRSPGQRGTRARDASRPSHVTTRPVTAPELRPAMIFAHRRDQASDPRLTRRWCGAVYKNRLPPQNSSRMNSRGQPMPPLDSPTGWERDLWSVLAFLPCSCAPLPCALARCPAPWLVARTCDPGSRWASNVRRPPGSGRGVGRAATCTRTETAALLTPPAGGRGGESNLQAVATQARMPRSASQDGGISGRDGRRACGCPGWGRSRHRGAPASPVPGPTAKPEA